MHGAAVDCSCELIEQVGLSRGRGRHARQLIEQLIAQLFEQFDCIVCPHSRLPLPLDGRVCDAAHLLEHGHAADDAHAVEAVHGGRKLLAAKNLERIRHNKNATLHIVTLTGFTLRTKTTHRDSGTAADEKNDNRPLQSE
jgi:hypothetical protein